MKYFEYDTSVIVKIQWQCIHHINIQASAVQMTKLEPLLHVYVCQFVSMTKVTDVIFIFSKTNLLYKKFFKISFVQINF